MGIVDDTDGERVVQYSSRLIGDTAKWIRFAHTVVDLKTDDNATMETWISSVHFEKSSSCGKCFLIDGT